MKKYDIIVNPEAEQDLINLIDYIENDCSAPLSAKRYSEGLKERILWLETGAEVFTVVPELTYEFGFEVRRLNYKKMTVLYTIKRDEVYILRILPSSMIIY